MKRTVLLLLIATLAVMVSIPAYANGTAASDQGAVTSESQMGTATGTTDQYGTTTEQGTTTQQGSTMTQGAVAQPGAVASSGTACAPVTTGQYGAYGTPTASATLQPGMINGAPIVMNPAISIQNQDVYVVAGNMIYKFDRNLNLQQQAALPFGAGGAFAYAPGQYGQYGQFYPYGTTTQAYGYGTTGQMYGQGYGTTQYPYGTAQAYPYGQSSQGQPLVCPPGTVAVQPGVAGFREQPAPMAVQPSPVTVQPAPVTVQPAQPTRWRATLGGTPLQVRTSASGDAEFWLSNQGQTLNYRINARNIRNVTAVNLQLLQPGMSMMNAPIVATIFSPRRATGAITGRVVSGAITARDLTGSFRGQPLSALINAINQGQIVVNVRTTRNPNGEIAGMPAMASS